MELMAARRTVAAARRAGNSISEKQAHDAVNQAKVKLGERGPAWWTDGAPDLNRRMIKNTPYADWYAAKITST